MGAVIRHIFASPRPGMRFFGDAKIIIASTVEVASWLLLRRWHLALGFVVSIAIASGINRNDINTLKVLLK